MTDGCTNPNCKAKKQSTHTTANCYWPGEGKEGQFPPNFGQRVKVNVATTTKSDDHFVLSAWMDVDPSSSGVKLEDIKSAMDRDKAIMALISKSFNAFEQGNVPTFMDSRASNTMFVSRDTFIEYTLMKSHTGHCETQGVGKNNKKGRLM